MVAIAQEKKIAHGRRMRVDTTVVETDIHYPTDSTLLGDGVRVLTRAMKKIGELIGAVGKGNPHSSGKIVSLFEAHTEIIRKGRAAKPTEFGKMVKIQEAEQQIVTHYEVYDERPSDSDLLVPALDVHEQQFGHPPRLVAADAGFFSAHNEATAHARGVKRVSIPTARPRAPSVRSTRSYAGSAMVRSGAPVPKAPSAS